MVPPCFFIFILSNESYNARVIHLYYGCIIEEDQHSVPTEHWVSSIIDDKRIRYNERNKDSCIATTTVAHICFSGVYAV